MELVEASGPVEGVLRHRVDHFIAVQVDRAEQQRVVDRFLTALQTGVRPDGRVLAPIMPWRAFASLTKQDAEAIVAFLRSVPPVSHKAPGPFGPTETPTSFVMKVVPPAGK